ncbi:hypothetical protein N0V95_003013 [Ascochyta clinopodiicola]|nr:hypothetical protein N0V95_003013 [Ascochyta clinopodiicola]
MAIKDSYKIGDFTKYASENFPDAFDDVADPGLYKFDSIARWRHIIASTRGPYPTEGYSAINGHISPFNLVAERSWPKAKRAASAARALARTRLALLVRFAYLLAGHIDRIENEAEEDLLLKFEDMCMHMQQQKKAIAKEQRKEEELFQRWAKEEELRRKAVANHRSNGQVKVEDEETETGEDEMGPNDHEQEESSSHSKRRAINDDDNSAQTGVQIIPGTRKRARLTPASTTSDLDLGTLNPLEQPSTQVQSILESLVKQCKAEAEREKTSQNKNLQAEIAQLRADLANHKQKTEDAEKKFEKHNADWQIQEMRQETEMLSLEALVEQWKEKYR